ncbi:hypothetical protein RIF29_05513 [Crotalaria pallida]|uniref:Uncharacterized protein n=1 Tax=Crotalaria pallida TaxID=3830 RepID=A0AAN9J3K3_CROPI
MKKRGKDSKKREEEKKRRGKESERELKRVVSEDKSRIAYENNASSVVYDVYFVELNISEVEDAWALLECFLKQGVSINHDEDIENFKIHVDYLTGHISPWRTGMVFLKSGVGIKI